MTRGDAKYYALLAEIPNLSLPYCKHTLSAVVVTIHMLDGDGRLSHLRRSADDVTSQQHTNAAFPTESARIKQLRSGYASGG